MNKLRLIRIYELRGKVHPLEAFMIDLLEGIEEVSINNYMEYNKKGKLYFHKDMTNDYFYLDYDLIFIFFKTKFICNYQETREITKYLLEKLLNIKVTTTCKLFLIHL